MKQVIAIFILLASTNVFAAVSNDSEIKQYHFSFKYKAETFEITKKAKDEYAALDSAATECFRHFKKSEGNHLSEKTGLDIIDVCANPRS